MSISFARMLETVLQRDLGHERQAQMVRPLSPEICWTFLVMTWMGAWLIQRVAMPVAGPRLCRLLLVSFGLRVSLALGFFAISYWRLPILTSLHHLPGFWHFATDANVYHYYGSRIASAWLAGTSIPTIEGLGVEYFAVVATAYTFFGSHPILAVVVNCLLGALSGLLAFAISRRLSDERQALVSACLVSFWPSTLIWSSQLLKDSLSLFLTLAVLLLIVQACAIIRDSRRIRILPLVAWCLALVSSVVLWTRIRIYLGSILSLAILVVLVPVAVEHLTKRRMRQSAGYLSLAAFVVVCVLFARSFNPALLLTPPHPERGHFRSGMRAWEVGHLDEAQRQFDQAITIDRHYTDAHLALATIDVQSGNFDGALLNYQAYLDQERDPQRQAPIRRLMAQIPALAPDPARLAAPERTVAAPAPPVAVLASEEAVPEEPLASAPEPPPAPAGLPAEPALLAASELAAPELVVAAPAPPVAVLASEDPVTLRASSAAFEEPLASAPEPPPAPAGLPAEPALLAAAPKLAIAAPAPPVAELHEHLMEQAAALFATSRSLRKGSVPDGTGQLAAVVDSFRQLDEQAVSTVQEATPEALGNRREGFVEAGGHSLIDPRAMISQPGRLLWYLPRALAIGLWAPFPWQWFDTEGSTGIMRTFAGIEMMLFYLLLPAMWVGIGRLVASRRVEAYVVLAWIVLTAVPLSLVVANLGTLFRLRLAFVLPLLIVAAHGRPLAMAQRIIRGLGRLRQAQAGLVS